jgi:hypothetical protein
MGAAEDFEKHVDECGKCVELSPGKWDLCEKGRELLAKVPSNDLSKTRLGPK